MTTTTSPLWHVPVSRTSYAVSSRSAVPSFRLRIAMYLPRANADPDVDLPGDRRGARGLLQQGLRQEAVLGQHLPPAPEGRPPGDGGIARPAQGGRLDVGVQGGQLHWHHRDDHSEGEARRTRKRLQAD